MAKKKAKKEKFVNVQRISQPQVILSKEQMMLNEMFNGERSFGTGRNLPKLNRTLSSGNGLIKSGDFGETANMFGMGR